MSEQRDDRSAKPVLGLSSGNCPNVSHQASTYRGAGALKADRKQTLSKDAATPSAGGSNEGRDWLVKLTMCCDTG